MSATHSADVELARRCAAGDEDAWRRFIEEYRPSLYRAADALDPSGGARELADALYADLLTLLRYYEGRSSLATWLRAVLAQRYVDRLRADRRLQPLPDDDAVGSAAFPRDTRLGEPDPDRPRYVALVRRALGAAVAQLSARDRLRLGCYYVQQLTLAETGRLLTEHEATVSRQLARTRRVLRDAVTRHLRAEGLSNGQIGACFKSIADDPGPLDLSNMIGGRWSSVIGRASGSVTNDQRRTTT